MSLTDTQLVLLSSARQHKDHLIALPPTLKGGAANKVVNKLLSLALAKELPVEGDQPAWRTDENERAIGLKITRAGLTALGIERCRKAARKRAPRAGPDQAPRPGSKQALVISLLSRAKGATLGQLVEATRWLPHTTRAALTGLRRRGHELAKTKNAAGQTVYRIEQEGSGSRRAKVGA